MSLTNDTLIHSLPYFCGLGVSLLMHLGWRASPPGPCRRSCTWESALLRMLFAQIAPFVFDYEMHFLNMTGDHIYPLRERLKCEGCSILHWDCLFISSLSWAVKKVFGFFFFLYVWNCMEKQKSNCYIQWRCFSFFNLKLVNLHSKISSFYPTCSESYSCIFFFIYNIHSLEMRSE